MAAKSKAFGAAPAWHMQLCKCDVYTSGFNNSWENVGKIHPGHGHLTFQNQAASGEQYNLSLEDSWQHKAKWLVVFLLNKKIQQEIWRVEVYRYNQMIMSVVTWKWKYNHLDNVESTGYQMVKQLFTIWYRTISILVCGMLTELKKHLKINPFHKHHKSVRNDWSPPTECICIWIKVADLAPWFQHTNYLSMTYKLVQRQLVAKILSQFSARQLERNITRNQKVTPVLLYSFKRNICANSKNSPPWISLK